MEEGGFACERSYVSDGWEPDLRGCLGHMASQGLGWGGQRGPEHKGPRITVPLWKGHLQICCVKVSPEERLMGSRLVQPP